MASSRSGTSGSSIWTGELGTFWSSRAEQYERLMASHTRRLVDAAGLTGDEQVLDVGCGTGPTTRLAGERAASVLGLDVSPQMVEVAQARTTLPHVTFAVGDAQTAPLPRVEVVLSQFGLMFFDDPAAAFDNLHHALVRGGRIAFLCWRAHAENENRTLPREIAVRYAEPPPLRPPGQPGAFSLADADVVRSLLAGAGFGEPTIEAVADPMVWGTTPDDAVAFLLADELEWLPDDVRDVVAAELREELAARDCQLRSASWLVTAPA